MRRILLGTVAATVLLTLGGNEHLNPFTSMFDLAGAILLAWSFYIVDFRSQ